MNPLITFTDEYIKDNVMSHMNPQRMELLFHNSDAQFRHYLSYITFKLIFSALTQPKNILAENPQPDDLKPVLQRINSVSSVQSRHRDEYNVLDDSPYHINIDAYIEGLKNIEERTSLSPENSPLRLHSTKDIRRGYLFSDYQAMQSNYTKPLGISKGFLERLTNSHNGGTEKLEHFYTNYDRSIRDRLDMTMSLKDKVLWDSETAFLELLDSLEDTQLLEYIEEFMQLRYDIVTLYLPTREWTDRKVRYFRMIIRNKFNDRDRFYRLQSI